MTAAFHVRRGALESPLSFFGSGLLHGLALAWLAFGTPGVPEPDPKQNIYDMTIRGNEKRIIWYRLSDKLPEVRPTAPREERAAARPLRATKKFDQSLVVGPKDNAKTPRMVWSPAPEIAAPKPQSLPNVIAVEQKPLTKPFTAPVPKLAAPVPAALPDAPAVTAKLGVAEAGPELKPLLKTFQRPEVRTARTNSATLPDAPAVTAKLGAAEAGPGLKPLVKPFERPAVKSPEAAAPALPAAPEDALRLSRLLFARVPRTTRSSFPNSWSRSASGSRCCRPRALRASGRARSKRAPPAASARQPPEAMAGSARPPSESSSRAVRVSEP